MAASEGAARAEPVMAVAAKVVVGMAAAVRVAVVFEERV